MFNANLAQENETAILFLIDPVSEGLRFLNCRNYKNITLYADRRFSCLYLPVLYTLIYAHFLRCFRTLCFFPIPFTLSSCLLRYFVFYSRLHPVKPHKTEHVNIRTASNRYSSKYFP
jgi:hypothetical protein